MINQVIIPILLLLANVISTVVIVRLVLGLLVAFNVVDYHNQVVSSLIHGLDLILNPMLRPIQRHMPDTGGIDFSPIVLLLIRIVTIIFEAHRNPSAMSQPQSSTGKPLPPRCAPASRNMPPLSSRARAARPGSPSCWWARIRRARSMSPPRARRPSSHGQLRTPPAGRLRSG